jgi:hypothetical protein
LKPTGARARPKNISAHGSSPFLSSRWVLSFFSPLIRSSLFSLFSGFGEVTICAVGGGMAVAGLGEAEAVGGGMARRRRSAAAWRGGRRRATSTPTETRTTTSGTHRLPPSPPRLPRPRGAPTDALLPHLGDHEAERRPPTPSFPTSATTRPSAASSLRRIWAWPPPPSAGSSTRIWAAAERCFFYFQKLIFCIGPFQPIQ